MASTLDELMRQLNNHEIYTPMTQKQVEKEAKRRYETVYNQKRLAARETYEQNDSELARELASLQSAYDDRRAQTRAENQQTYALADRQSMSRGMQRSSYNSATLANIDLAGDAALGALSNEQSQQEDDIAHQRTQLRQQLNRQLSQYDADQRSETLAYADQLAQREYERARESRETANKLAMQLYEYQRELEREAAEQARWQAEFNAKYGSASAAPTKRKSSSQASAQTVSQPSASKSSKPSVPTSGVRKNSRELLY